MDKLTLTIPEVAEQLNLSRSQTYELCRSGQIPGVLRLGVKRLVVSRAILVRWIEQAGAGSPNESEGDKLHDRTTEQFK